MVANHQKGSARRRALQAAFLACGAPLGWLAILLLSGADPIEDLRRQPGLYAYMLLGTLFVFTLYGYYVGQREQESENRSLRDALTGLFNARYFWRRLSGEIEAARRTGLPLSLVMLDLDHFKKVNDVHGHAAGDAVLRALARILGETSRKSDAAARVGGEEFALILPYTDTEAAVEIAERLRRRLEAREIVVDRLSPIRITCSFGVAQWQADGVDSPQRLYDRADAALYRAKKGGRNRVEIDGAAGEAPANREGREAA